MLTPTLPGLSLPVERKAATEVTDVARPRSQRPQNRKQAQPAETIPVSTLNEDVHARDETPQTQLAPRIESQLTDQSSSPTSSVIPTPQCEKIQVTQVLTTADSWPAIFYGSSISRCPQEIRRPSMPRSAALNLPPTAPLRLPTATTRIYPRSTRDEGPAASTEAHRPGSRRTHATLDPSRLSHPASAKDTLRKDAESDNSNHSKLLECANDRSSSVERPVRATPKTTVLPAIPQSRVVPRPAPTAGETVAPLRQSLTVRQPSTNPRGRTASANLTERFPAEKTDSSQSGIEKAASLSASHDRPEATPNAGSKEEQGYWFGDGEHISGAVRSTSPGRVAIDHVVLGHLMVSENLLAERLVEIFLRNGDRLIGDLVRETNEDVTIRHTSLGEITVRRSEICPRVANYLLKNGDRIVGEVLAENEERIELHTSALGVISVPRSGIRRVLQKTY